MKANETTVYDASKIRILEGLEAVRKRPGMYIGTQDESGLHKMLYEVLDNSVDEHTVGYGTIIKVRILKGNIVEIEDNGRGIPVEKHPQAGISTLEVVMTKLHAGGKFEKEAYKISGGLHGVGVSVVNALSRQLEVEVYHDGSTYYQAYERGIPLKAVQKKKQTSKQGTLVRFLADSTIFSTTEFDRNVVLQKLEEIAYLNNGLKIQFSDERKETIYTQKIQFKGGIREMIEKKAANREYIHKRIIHFQGIHKDLEGEFALLYTNGRNDYISCYTNGIANPLGGTHLEGFRSAITRTLNDFLEHEQKLKKKVASAKLSGDDTREGLLGIIKIRIAEPQFNSQTKEKLVNREIKSAVQQLVSEKLKLYFEENASELKRILEKCVLSYQAREAARKARELVSKRKGFLENNRLPGKLADCSEANPAKSELFIVEGDSAGGSAKQGRNRDFQAVLPLRGKLVNVLKNPEAVLSNDSIHTLIASLGIDIGLEQDTLKKLRYHKVIIMTDADVDGAHIRTLLLTLFYTQLQFLINHGHLYIAQPPLYLIKVGKENNYAYSDQEKDKLIQKHEGQKYTIQRYKGLGEMNADQLWETTMDPERRIMWRIAPIAEKQIQETEEIFQILMSNQVEPRRDFIYENAKFAKNIDL